MRATEDLGAAGGLEPACRFLMALMFLMAAAGGLLSPSGFAAGLGQMGVPFPAVAGAAATTVNIAGPVLLVLDIRRTGWIGAFALAGFTALTIPYGHAFWRFAEPRRTEEMRIAIEHIGIIGGLTLAGLTSYRRWRDHRLARPR